MESNFLVLAIQTKFDHCPIWRYNPMLELLLRNTVQVKYRTQWVGKMDWMVQLPVLRGQFFDHLVKQDSS